jgi:glycosyltransferase involved in cell wall biosynthesis
MYEIPYELSRQNIDVSCFSLSYRREGSSSKRINPHFHWSSIDIGIYQPHGIFKIINKILDHVHSSKPDIIVAASDVIHLGIGSYISKKTGIPLVSDLYDNFESYGLTKLPFMQSIYRNALEASRAVTCVSRPLSEYIKRYCNADCEIITIENAVNHAVFKPLSKIDSRKRLSLPENGILIGTAGALYDSRDISVLFSAYKLLQIERPDIHLVLAGRSSSKMPIPNHINVHYLGELEHSDVANFYNALDLAIVPLLNSEFGKYCFPQKACEILACKRPVVASSVGVMKDLFKDYPECLFEEGNATMLAERILKQLNRAVVPDIVVPDWSDQAKIIVNLLLKICNAGHEQR